MIYIQQGYGGVDPCIKVSLSSADQIREMRDVDFNAVANIDIDTSYSK